MLHEAGQMKSNMYQSVCNGERDGFNITLGQLALGPVTARVECDALRSCESAPEKPLQCAAGYGAHAFARADGDDNASSLPPRREREV